mmetsp:Transcript_89166/g.257055  ORF Transcript_89166/g.257055 Transcript_89166/m.257055 type:complete len:218 (+) Transcript_89166:271-924(+)
MARPHDCALVACGQRIWPSTVVLRPRLRKGGRATSGARGPAHGRDSVAAAEVPGQLLLYGGVEGIGLAHEVGPDAPLAAAVVEADGYFARCAARPHDRARLAEPDLPLGAARIQVRHETPHTGSPIEARQSRGLRRRQVRSGAELARRKQPIEPAVELDEETEVTSRLAAQSAHDGAFVAELKHQQAAPDARYQAADPVAHGVASWQLRRGQRRHAR